MGSGRHELARCAYRNNNIPANYNDNNGGRLVVSIVFVHDDGKRRCQPVNPVVYGSGTALKKTSLTRPWSRPLLGRAAG